MGNGSVSSANSANLSVFANLANPLAEISKPFLDVWCKNGQTVGNCHSAAQTDVMHSCNSMVWKYFLYAHLCTVEYWHSTKILWLKRKSKVKRMSWKCQIFRQNSYLFPINCLYRVEGLKIGTKVLDESIILTFFSSSILQSAKSIMSATAKHNSWQELSPCILQLIEHARHN